MASIGAYKSSGDGPAETVLALCLSIPTLCGAQGEERKAEASDPDQIVSSIHNKLINHH